MPRIFNDAGTEIDKGFVGPLSLGSDLTLICEVGDGMYPNQFTFVTLGNAKVLQVPMSNIKIQQ